MMKTALLLGVIGLSRLLNAPAARAQACVSMSNAGACFEAYDAATGQRLGQRLCVGRPVRLRDCSGKRLDPAQIYYRRGAATLCTGFTDTTTTFTPTGPGPLVITQNTQGSTTGSQGLIFSKNYEVVDAPAPTFTVAACTPGFVQVTVTDSNYNQYFVQIGGAAPVPAAPNTAVSYPVAPPNTVTVIGRNSQAVLCDGVSAPLPFTPLPPPRVPRPDGLAVAGDGSASFTLEAALQPEYRYQLQVADAAAPGGYRNVTTLPGGITTFTLPAAPLPGCFRVLLQDQCQPPVVSQPSAEICSVRLTGTALNGRNQLSWASAGTGTYLLTRTAGTTTVPLPLPAGGATEYTDAAVSCGVTYRYRLSLSNGLAVSVANEVSLTTLSTAPPAVPRLEASFNLRNQVVLAADVPGAPAGGQLSYQRDGTALATTPARSFSDSVLLPDPAAPLCYAVSFQDECGNRAPASSSLVCPVRLTAAAATLTGSDIRLAWSALTGPDPAGTVSYRVLTLSPTNVVVASVPVGPALTYLDLAPPPDQQTVRYRVEATGAGLAAPSFSNVAAVTRAVKVFVPTAFTPNDDGLNDVLELKGRFLGDFRFTIIDRNGQPVFQTTDRTRSWDGRIGSSPPVPGAYVWQFEATDQAGRRTTEHGTVTILR